MIVDVFHISLKTFELGHHIFIRSPFSSHIRFHFHWKMHYISKLHHSYPCTKYVNWGHIQGLVTSSVAILH